MRFFVLSGIYAVTATVLFSCNESEGVSTNPDITYSEEQYDQADTQEHTPYTDEQHSAVVYKGGPKAEGQLFLEDQLNILAKNREEKKGTLVEKLLGHWTGDFGKNKINVTLVEINEVDFSVSGYSVCAGNFRPLKGTYSKVGAVYDFVLSEPGDDPYDGKFEFTINPERQTMFGEWTPFKQEGNTAKKYELFSQDYYYLPEAGQFEASSRLLSDEDVQNESVEDLKLMRNEIYARHGYCFKDKEMRSFFEAQDWYMPMGVDIRHQLTDIEIANISLIYEYETYYEEYADDFGR